MKAVCDSVIERIALGEPLGELAEHVASCDHCKPLVDMPRQLGASRHPVDPGLGFAARMTIGAQQRLAVRRRQRVAVGLAGAVAAGLVGVFVMTRSPEHGTQQPAMTELPVKDTNETPVVADEADLKSLVQFADTRRASRVSAPWVRITKPLAPYKKLVKGLTP